MGEDMKLTGAYFAIPYKYPANFPVNTIAVARFLRVLQDKQPDKLIPATDAFYVSPLAQRVLISND